MRSVSRRQGSSPRTSGSTRDPARFDEGPEQQGEIIALADEAFGMPLHADDEAPIASFHGFDHAVFGPCRDYEPGAEGRHRLMVEAVHRENGAPPEDLEKVAVALDGDVVGMAVACTARIVIDVARDLGRYVLDQRSTQRDVQHLHPPADREHRHVALDGGPAQRDLEQIPVAEDLGFVHRRMARLTEDPRVDVAPAGENEAVDVRQDLVGVPGLAGSEAEREAARGFHRSGVVVAKGESTLGSGVVCECDADPGPGHIFSGSGMPRRSRSHSISATKRSTTFARATRNASLWAWSTECAGF